MAKKKEAVSAEDSTKSKYELAMEKLNKSYGKGTVFTLDTKQTFGNYDVISTGSIGFDYITLGVGGMVKGKLYELMGWEGSGKSTICGHIVATCQAQGGVAAYIDGEHAFDKTYFQALGVDTSKLIFSQPACGEEGFQIAEELIKSGELDLIVIDSDSSLIPKAAIEEGEIGDSSIGKKARLNSSAYPRLKNALVKHNTCVIVVSQYREKIGMMFGDSKTTQGGHALKFYADCRIEVTKTLAKNGDTAYGNTTKVKAIKNKTCPPYRVAGFTIIWGKGIDKVGEIFELALEFEIITKYGQVITYKSVKYDLETFKILLADNPELFDELKNLVVAKLQNTDNIPTESPDMATSEV